VRIKITLDQLDDLLILRYRAYQRSGIRTISYMARITGPHPDYVLARSFLNSYSKHNARWDSFVCCVAEEGIYEIVIKRFAADDRYISRERKWLVVAHGQAYLYEDQEMNAQYVLYCAWLLSPQRFLCA